MSAYHDTASPSYATWKTNDGRTLPIEWMQTQHLCHAFNMLCRKHNLDRNACEIRFKVRPTADALQFIHDELVKRGALEWNGDSQLSVIKVSSRRETPAELCLMRTLLDLGEKMLYFGVLPATVETVLALSSDKVRAKYAEYRLDYPG